jgi:signal transduction histidine kinase
VLELQEQERVFVASLAANRDGLPDVIPGSRLQITGVYDDEPTASPAAAASHASAPQIINILLRSQKDVVVLSGPPWWTWKRTATLVGTLLTILIVTLLWIHLLHRRLERQNASRLAFSRQVLERLEDERRRIAINLHDSLGQTLLVIKNHAIFAMQASPEEKGLRHRLDEISGTTSQAIEEVRRITHGLRPYQLDRLGLTQAVRALTDRASRHNSILFASRINDIDDLFDKDSEIHVYRIVQEAITNVLKHSAATEATVVVKKWATVVSLSIRDNGRGFDPAKQSAQRHDLGYGLSGIAERVRILKGTLTLDSKPGEGTSLTVEVPFPNPRL